MYAMHLERACTELTGASSPQLLSVDISDRPKHEDLITYKLSGEVLVPCISISDVASIFEEHRICKHLGILSPQQPCLDGVGVYGEDNRKFLFSSVIVGNAAKARFKLSNPHKVRGVRVLLGASAAYTLWAYTLPTTAHHCQPSSFCFVDTLRCECVCEAAQCGQ